jgi:serine/threonine-protein kinase
MGSNLSIDELRESFPDVTFQREIEEGNIKQVFEATYEGQHVAFKVVTYEEDSRLEGYTEREIDIMRQTESDVLVDFMDAYDTEINGKDAYVIIEEFIEGDSLKEVISNSGNSPELAVKVTDGILDVLPEFDEGEIVHRDIKPENIRIAEDGEIRLLDVGVARMNERETLTPGFSNRGPGTPAYSAPEVLRNERYNQDVKTDLFSTGIVFFETTTGEHPFNTLGARSHSDAILANSRRELSGYLENTELEEDFNEFFKRLTAHEPARRFRKPEFAQEKLNEIKEAWF